MNISIQPLQRFSKLSTPKIYIPPNKQAKEPFFINPKIKRKLIETTLLIVMGFRTWAFLRLYLWDANVWKEEHAWIFRHVLLKRAQVCNSMLYVVNGQLAPENGTSRKESMLFQPYILQMLVFRSVFYYLLLIKWMWMSFPNKSRPPLSRRGKLTSPTRWASHGGHENLSTEEDLDFFPGLNSAIVYGWDIIPHHLQGGALLGMNGVIRLYKWVTRVRTSTSGVISLLKNLVRAHLVDKMYTEIVG